MKITWTEYLTPIQNLKDYDRNPRRIKDAQYKNLVKSLKEDGYHQRLVVNTDFTIIGGHQRKRALLDAGFKLTDKIPVLVPSRFLDKDDFQRINIKDNLPYGEYDFDMLTADFDIDQLLEWGIPEEWLPIGEEPAEESKEEENGRKVIECPKCGHEF